MKDVLHRLSGARRDEILMFAVMLSVAIGNTGLQSVMPAIGRTLELPDTLVALAFSLSALLWAACAPLWARRMRSQHARRSVLIGLSGFVGALSVCGLALTAGVRGWLPAVASFGLFIVGRGIYGAIGSASPPAAQAIVIASTARDQRTAALSMLASAFGLGTIIGPALAPIFILPVVGLAGPLFIFAAFGAGMMMAVRLLLPPGFETGRGVPTSEPAVGYGPEDNAVQAAASDPPRAAIRLFDRRIRSWMIVGLVAGHAQVITAQTLAFLVIDRLADSPAQAQPLVGMVLMCGAGAALLAQWGLVPRFGMQPRSMIVWGFALAAIGNLGCAFAADLHMLAIAFAIASLGFGFLRPGYTAGASLAVSEEEQALVAGHVTSVNGVVFLFGPFVGIGLYQFHQALPYLLSAAAMAAMTPYAARALRRAA